MLEKTYFKQQNAVHIQCQLEDYTVKQPQRDVDEHRALRKDCLSAWKCICSQLWQQSIAAVIAEKPWTFCFTASVASTAAPGSSVRGSSSHMAIALKNLFNCCWRSDRPFARGDIETTSSMHCGWSNRIDCSGTMTSAWNRHKSEDTSSTTMF